MAPQPGISAADFQQALVAQGGRSLGPLRGLDVHAVEVPIGGEQDAVARLAGNAYVLFAELDGLTAPALKVNDPNFRKEWHLAKISAPTAWDTSIGSGITIAILDTGVDGTHPDLAAQMVPGWNLFDDNDNTADVLGHGTAVAGVAAAASNNGLGIAGVAGGARIMPLRITDAAGNAYWSTTAQALTWAADHGADVANISFEGMAASSTMQAAATYFRSNGGTVIVAAGNTGAIDNTAPTDTMVVVSATDSRDRITSWSTRGSFVDISAPGQSIYSTAKGGGYGTWSGTSMAAPMVAGTAALVFALRPDLTPAQVDSTLLASATDLGAIGRDIYYGYGRLNAAAAVQAAAAMPTVATPTSVTTTPAAPLPACTRANPTLTITPSQSAGVQAGTMVPFNVTVTNNDTTACTASTFDLTRSIPAGWTATFLSLALSLSPGTSGSTTLQVTSPAGTTNSSNAITATATNRNATTFLRSASATYVVANPVQPVCTRANPTVTITPSPSASAQAGGMVPFNVAVTNNDTSACAASTFDLTRTMPAGWTATFLSLALSLAPGTSGATTLQITSPMGTRNGSNPISATATNRSATTFLRSASTTYVVANGVKWHPGHYLLVYLGYTNSDVQKTVDEIAGNPGILGIQRRYTWKDLEPSKDVYDFSAIQGDLQKLASVQKRLVIQIQIKSTTTQLFVPSYILSPTYEGGVYTTSYGGYNLAYWNANLQQRLAALVNEMGKRFDSHPNLEAVTLDDCSRHPGSCMAHENSC